MTELTTNELVILKVLWENGRLSAREIHDALSSQRDWSYSTSRTLIERMVKKGLLTKDAYHGLNLYQAAISKAQGLAPAVKQFAELVLERDLGTVVNLFTGSQALTRKELEELQTLLELQPEDVHP